MESSNRFLPKQITKKNMYDKPYVPKEGEITINHETPRTRKVYDRLTGKPSIETSYSGKIFLGGKYHWLNLQLKTYKSGKLAGQNYLWGSVGSPIEQNNQNTMPDQFSASLNPCQEKEVKFEDIQF